MSGHSRRTRSYAQASNGIIRIQIAPEVVSDKSRGTPSKWDKPKRMLNYFHPKINSAVRLAMNRSLDAFSTEMIRATAKTYYVQQKELRSATRIIHVKPTFDLKEGLQGVMISQGHRKSLTKYKIFPGRAPVKPGSFRGAVMRAGGLKPIPKAFLMPTSRGLRAVIREGPGYEGLVFLSSPSVPQLMKNKFNVNRSFAVTEAVFEKRLDHEVMRLLGVLP